MTEHNQKLNQTLKSIAEITLNLKSNNTTKLKKAAGLIAKVTFNEDSELLTMFTAVHEMTANYIDKLLKSETDDIGPLNDGIILLRSIARSENSKNNFGFIDKDIENVVENLQVVNSQDETIAQIQNISQTLKEIATITLSIQPDNIAEIGKIADMLSNLYFDDKHESYGLFSAVRDMTCGYIDKLRVNEVDDMEAVKDGIVLLRAIIRSIITGNEFVFGENDLSEVVENLKAIKSESDPIEISDNNKNLSERLLNEVKGIISSSSSISHDDIPALGIFLNIFEEFEANLSDDLFKDALMISKGLRSYIEKLVLGDETDSSLIFDSLEMIQAILKSLSKGEDFSFGIDDMVERLGSESITTISEPEPSPPEAEKVNETIAPEISQPVVDLTDEDIEILGDFILEAKDNLESIEINLIELEESPENTEIINAIFRPFHTIKGVSGFLDLRKINALSHSTENLLDSSRQGNFIIDHDIADLILRAVDVLKQLIDKVEKGLEYGKTADDSEIKINELIRQIENTNASGKADKKESETTSPIGEILVDQGSLNKEDLSKALQTQQESPGKKLGEILLDEQKVESKEIISALRTQKKARRQNAPQVKVDTNKLDNLVDLTGELVIAQSMLRQRNSATTTTDQKLIQNLNQLGQIVSNIQKIAMSMRMVPINATFQKMVRLVRDLSRNCNKDVALEMFGEETEIDRNVVEALYEPMVHMIRNSIDHGLETGEEREASGKSSKGAVTLRAYHKGGNIVIEISDNGKGLNKISILEKAISSGVISGDADLSDSEIFQLIMAPGFSTAEEITDISGRGVGMDVVKKAIIDLNGRIDIQSEEGKGSTFTISLPLTLAIIEGMLVRIGQEKFIIPTMAILESFRPSQDDYYTVEKKGEMLMFRKSLIPVVRLNRICDVEMDNKDIWENIVVVVENKDDQRGIVVDELLGKEEFVIKNLGESLKGIQGVAGGAILGDGRIGLIIDISGLFTVSDSF